MTTARNGLLQLVVASAVIAGGCVDDPTAATLPDELRAKVPAEVLDALTAGTSSTLVIALDPAGLGPSAALAAAASGPDADLAATADRAAWAGAKQRLVEATLPGSVIVERTWDQLPLVQVHVASIDALAALLARPELAAAFPIQTYQLSDAESFALIRQPAAAAAGKVGAGTSIAVLDTGVNYARPELGACTGPGVPATCRVAFAQDFAPSDGQLDDNGHGTNVAGIAAGVAPGASILALDVFTGAGASSTDIISAINWTIANQATYHIAAMNLSLGGGSATAPCTSDAIGIALGAARAKGIAPVVAAGNNGFSNALSSPGCAPAAISVGAVYDTSLGGIGYSSCQDATTAADKITCFSNSASFLTVLAPGALITAAGSTMAGTSQAAPHVAGALAVLRGAFPGDTVDQLVARLTSTGKPISDPRNGITKPRIDLFAALGTAPADTTRPTDGTVTATPDNAIVRLVWTGFADAGSGVRSYRVVGAAAATPPASCAGTVLYDGATPSFSHAGLGNGTTYSYRVCAVDGAGNVSAGATASATPRPESMPPVGSIAINAGAPRTRLPGVTLTLLATDASTVTAMCVTEATACTAFVPYATSQAYTFAAGDGARRLSVWYRDRWGNTSAPVAATIVLDTLAPTGGMLGATASTDAITLAWSAGADAGSGVAAYRLVANVGTLAPAVGCTTGTALYSGPGLTARHAVARMTTWSYRLCVVDGAGNVSAGSTRTISAL